MSTSTPETSGTGESQAVPNMATANWHAPAPKPIADPDRTIGDGDVVPANWPAPTPKPVTDPEGLASEGEQPII